jgi:hypothetical protein
LGWLLNPWTVHDVQDAARVAVLQIRQQLGRQQEAPTTTFKNGLEGTPAEIQVELNRCGLSN